MIETISLSKTATYGEQPEVLGPLRRVNFIFGTNGTGKTTIGRVIANVPGHAQCGVVWKDGRPIQALVYNRDFVESNFSRSAELKGVFTLGEKQVKAQEEIKAKKQEVDSFKEKVVNLSTVLDGADGASGKRSDLTTLEASFQERCWEAYGKHKERLSLAFEGFRNSKKDFKAKALHEAESNKSLAVPLDDNFARIVTELCTAYPNVYCEIGYITELFNSTNQAIFLSNLERVIQRGTGADQPYHLLDKMAYGSDWHMPEMGDRTREYLNIFLNILNREAYQEYLDRFFWKTAYRYLNLAS